MSLGLLHCIWVIIITIVIIRQREREGRGWVGLSDFQIQVGLLTCKFLVLETEGSVSPKVLHPYTSFLSLNIISLYKLCVPLEKPNTSINFIMIVIHIFDVISILSSLLFCLVFFLFFVFYILSISSKYFICFP